VQKITPFLWFDGKAEEAANFYVAIFKNSKIKGITRYGDAGPGPKGSVMTVALELDGQEFVLLNGGPQFQFSMATSFVVNCETQKEVDDMWDELSAGGKTLQCGWLTDKYGLSWQIVPTALPKLVLGQDQAKVNKVMQAMLGMTKIDIATLQHAYEQA
jgi:predicted 3-demethylubiquinone-9 3-methyltransferase (glyoxalase superfamily)